VRSQIAHLPLTPEYRGPAEFGRFMQEETTRWSEVIRNHNITLD
jgi:tripartite-type tricarboxylate transporter receptor subunit TctC